MLFTRYLQQLVMESLGKEQDLDGNVVHQGIAVYGNKGSTDQHAYVQQLRDGVDNFFVTFIEVLRDRDGAERSRWSRASPRATTSHGLLFGHAAGARRERSARRSRSRSPDVSARSLGMLIALYERAVGLYASLVEHQRLPPAGRRGGQEGGGVRARAAAQAARGARRARRARRDLRGAGRGRGRSRRGRDRVPHPRAARREPRARHRPAPGIDAVRRHLFVRPSLDRRFPMLRSAASAAALLLVSALSHAEVATKEVDLQAGRHGAPGLPRLGRRSQEEAAGRHRRARVVGPQRARAQPAIRLAEAGYVGFALDMYGKGKVADAPRRRAGVHDRGDQGPGGGEGARSTRRSTELKQDPHVDPERDRGASATASAATVALEPWRGRAPTSTPS